MSRIHQLTADVVNKIAAGEVVERPGSVVKELLENSIDALATRIDVDVQQGGIELIRITDDGEGIHPDDLTLAVTSHATSKIATADDLFRVHTLGFRGEALASIASVSRFRIRSRQTDAECGYEIDVPFGVVGEIKPCGCPVGTMIEVRQLFANTPVRRKFLRTPATEFGHLAEQFTRIALANPRLHLVLRHNDRIVHELPASTDLTDRIRRFFGTDIVQHLIEIDSESDGIRLWGFVAHPSQSKSTRKGQHLFLNGRWIQDRSLQHALGEAYRGLLMTGRYPIVFLFLEVAPDQVDVNVHPTKAEVRFRDGQRLYRQLLASLRNRFLSLDLNATMNWPGKSASLQAAPANPERQHELQLGFAKWAKDQLASALAPLERTESLPNRAEAEQGPPTSDSQTIAPPAGSFEDFLGESEPTPSTQHEVARIDSPAVIPPAQHSPMPRVMQVHDCYLVIESEEGLTLIDQHALHERILYEHLRSRVLNGAVESQRMLVPDSVEFTSEESAALLENEELLAQLGFRVEAFGGSTLLLSAYPAMLPKADHPRLLRDIAEALLSAGAQPDRRDLLDSLLHSMSCRAAIKAGQRLTTDEMESLLAQRHLVENSHHCPHGRPTALTLTRQELDRQFGRLG